MKNINIFKNKVVLITGGTGSFGQECTSQLLKKKVKKIIIFSRDELKQYEMLKNFNNNNKIRFFLGDVRDFDRLELAFRKVNYVIHAAALKQVPAAEYNPMECIKTNIFGAENVIRASLKNDVEKVIALSTDKAANPLNLYGATKLCSDKLFTNANHYSGNKLTKFFVVRYGNVIGSRGSVLPLFKQLIEEKSKFLPITHEKMTRFWISLDEGVRFVLESINLGFGGEIFIPKMPSIKIVDLARSLDSKINLKIIGIRPGEKIHETLCPAESVFETIEFKKYFVIRPSVDFSNGINKNYTKSRNGELGKKVNENFIYSSDKNDRFLKINEIKKLN